MAHSSRWICANGHWNAAVAPVCRRCGDRRWTLPEPRVRATVRNFLRELLRKVHSADVVEEIVNEFAHAFEDGATAEITPVQCQNIADSFQNSLPLGFRICFLRFESFFVHFHYFAEPSFYARGRVPSIIIDDSRNIIRDERAEDPRVLRLTVLNVLQELLQEVYIPEIVEEFVDEFAGEFESNGDAEITSRECQIIANAFRSSFPLGFRIWYLHSQIFFLHFRCFAEPSHGIRRRMPSIVVDSSGNIIQAERVGGPRAIPLAALVLS